MIPTTIAVTHEHHTEPAPFTRITAAISAGGNDPGEAAGKVTFISVGGGGIYETIAAVAGYAHLDVTGPAITRYVDAIFVDHDGVYSACELTDLAIIPPPPGR